MKTYDLKSHQPTILDAGRLMADKIREARLEKHKVIKIIHGYGSTGVGGDIRIAIRKSPRNRVKKADIKAFIPGEAFCMLMGFDEVIKTYQHLISSDSDYKKCNEGITYIIL